MRCPRILIMPLLVKMNEEAEDKWLDRNCWTNKSRLYRYFALLNICILGFGEFVAYDSLGALQIPIMSILKLNAQEFSYFYSVGSWPSVVLCFFGGFFIDKVFGIKVGAVLYASVVLIGHCIFSLGILINNFWCALAGRFFFSIGVEFILICLLYYSVYYFKGKELSLVQCLTMALSRLGSSAAFEMAFPILDFVKQFDSGEKEVGIVLLIMGVFSVVSLISAIILLFMSPKNAETSKDEVPCDKEVKLFDVFHFGSFYWLAVITSCAFCMNIYIILPFSQGFFTTMHGLTEEDANTASGLFSLAGAVSAFVVGQLVDKIGFKLTFVIFGFIIALISHALITFTLIQPFITMCILAISFSILAASIFPLYAYMVPSNQLGTAYGAKQSIVNMTYAIIIIISGVIVDVSGYKILGIFIMCNVFVGLAASVIMWWYDLRISGILNMSTKQIRLFEMKKNLPAETMEPLNQESWD